MKLSPKHKTRLKRIILTLTILTLTYTSLYYWSIKYNNITIDVAERIAYGEALKYCIDNKLSDDCRGEMELISRYKTYSSNTADIEDIYIVVYSVGPNSTGREIISVTLSFSGIVEKITTGLTDSGQ